MKQWTAEFVTSLWASGGFDGIAELHNRKLGQLKRKMNDNREEAEHNKLGIPLDCVRALSDAA
jgi:hypothetical protein